MIPGVRSDRVVEISSLCWLSVADSRFTLSSARVISALCSSSPPTKVFRLPISERAAFSLPPNASLSWRVMFWIWATPPPLSSSESAPKTSSISGAMVESASGITAPSRSAPAGDCTSGGASSTNFSPRMLDCRSRAIAFAGSLTSPLIRSVTSALRPSAASSTCSTLPTATSLTLTPDCGTRSSTFGKLALTVNGWSPSEAPPGSGRS